jgi:hypothetical protein
MSLHADWTATDFSDFNLNTMSDHILLLRRKKAELIAKQNVLKALCDSLPIGHEDQIPLHYQIGELHLRLARLERMISDALKKG